MTHSVTAPQEQAADPLARHNVHVFGRADAQPILFAHGYGCDQHMWRHVAPAFEDDFRVVLFDYVGAGGADLASYDPDRYSVLDAYADDVLEICEALNLTDVILVGHSVSSMIGGLAVIKAPERFSRLVMVSPSPRYTDDEGYVGGFDEQDIQDLIDSIDSNFLGWSAAMAPVIMGNPDRPALGEELTDSFCRTDPAAARQFARVTFLSDTRDMLADIPVPTLVLQCSHDAIAPTTVGEYVHAAIPESTFVMLDATGHCPHLSAPEETTAAIAEFVRR